MTTGTPREAAHAVRVRWLFSLLYIGALRGLEICDSTMGGFFMRRSVDGKERWWLEVTGKDRKIRLVPVTAEMLAELDALPPKSRAERVAEGRRRHTARAPGDRVPAAARSQRYSRDRQVRGAGNRRPVA